MTIEELYETERARLEARLTRMLGSREAAEDVAQEAVVRTWQRARAGLDANRQAAWLHRTATNLAIDELRRRRLTSHLELDDLQLEATSEDTTEVLAAREALSTLSPHERLILLLRFERGLSHGEIGALLDHSGEAARKRCERARRKFTDALRGTRRVRRPLLLVAARDGFDGYRSWLERAGAEVRPAAHSDGAFERQLAGADGFLLGGGATDLHPAFYGERPRTHATELDPDRDVRDLRLLRAALTNDIPVVGICLGHQLLNVALRGTLYQDLYADRIASRPHVREMHAVSTAGSSLLRRVLGRRANVVSEHHQATRQVGRGLRVSAASEDGVIEGVELPGRRLRFGVQWHPEAEDSGEAGRRLSATLIEVASR
jgi:putative glutamine amidotransferase